MGFTVSPGISFGSGINFRSIISPVTSNLLFNLDAGNKASYSGTGSTWTDLTGTSNGTLVNTPTFTNAGVSSYFTFNGSNQYVNMGSLNLQRTWTLELWAWVTADNSGFFGQGTTSTNVGLHILYLASGGRYIIFGMYANDLDTSYVLTYNTWYQFVFTYSHSTYLKQFYANGVFQNSNTGAAYGGSGQFNIGGTYSAATSPINGRIAASRMYSTVLTAPEVAQNYAALQSRYTNIVTSNLLFNLDAGISTSYGGSGTTWTDLTGTSNGTLVNSPTFTSSGATSYFTFNGSNQYVNMGSLNL
ncbi:MAG: hypothetical protein EBX50_20425, partial [Chitinophagia bacterium]|nr:hypothetical protein [Chitinophagia bacterium]